MSEVNNTATFTTIIETSTAEISNGWSGSSIGTILIVLLVTITGLVVGGYFIYRKLKERRRNHGEYRPQFEEYQHAKNLPYLQPPCIEGLI
uniref:Uncharacterized protein n=1 Tax=Setaria digitata TaxID=48799 RepID=A0A915PHM3_9BILA